MPSCHPSVSVDARPRFRHHIQARPTAHVRRQTARSSADHRPRGPNPSRAVCETGRTQVTPDIGGFRIVLAPLSAGRCKARFSPHPSALMRPSERVPARSVPSKRAGTHWDGRKQGPNSADGCGEDRASEFSERGAHLHPAAAPPHGETTAGGRETRPGGGPNQPVTSRRGGTARHVVLMTHRGDPPNGLL